MGLRVQLEELNMPDPLLEKLTIPVGAIGDPDDVSVTTAVQVVGWFTATEGGLQETIVLVVRTSGGGGGATMTGLVTWKTAEFPAKLGSR